MWRFAESLRKKINKQMWVWQAWQWATPPDPLEISNAVVLSASSTPVGKSAHAV